MKYEGLKAYSVVASSDTENYINGETNLVFEAYDADDVDALLAEKDKEIRRLRRALYKACANWALSTLAWLDCIDQGEPRKWSEMMQKCRAKAEEYK